jgi:hypothetical protein
MAVTLDPCKSFAPVAPAKGPASIGSLVVSAAGKTLQRDGAVMASLMSQWPAIAGPSLAAYAIPAKLTKGAFDPAFSKTCTPSVLHLKVEPAKTLEVQYSVPQLIERINQALGYRAVSQLRLVQAPLGLSTKAKRPSPAATSTNLKAEPEARLGSALARMAAGIKARQA